MSFGPPAECWACGRYKPVESSMRGGPLCSTCYRRWQYHGFAGPGPGPSEKPPVIENVREYADVITSMSAAQAAAKLGRSARTICRWRAALREAMLS